MNYEFFILISNVGIISCFSFKVFHKKKSMNDDFEKSLEKNQS